MSTLEATSVRSLAMPLMAGFSSPFLPARHSSSYVGGVASRKKGIVVAFGQL